MANNQAEKEWEGKLLDHEYGLREFLNSLKWNKNYIIRVPEEVWEKGEEVFLKKNIAQNFHKLGKETGIQV